MIVKLIRNVVESVKPTFEKGGRLGFLHSLFDAVDTLLFLPNTVTRRGSHIRDAVDLKRALIVVVIALVPALLFGMYNVGLQHFRAVGDVAAAASIWGCWWYGFVRMLPLIVVSYAVGLGIEIAFAQKRGHEVSEGYFVTGMLIPLIMPIDVPLWMVALAVAFSVVFCKEVFGGSGMNVFNPALVARAFVFFAYTPFISGDRVWIRGAGKGGEYIDGFSGATPLTQLGENAQQFLAEPKIWDWIVGTIPGSIGETSVIAIGIGAVILLVAGVASLRVMASVFAGGWLMGLLFNLIGGSAVMDMPAYYHLLLGGFAFGAVFMATDPVTAAQTGWGKVIVGLLTGALAVMIRVVNPGYPEGMMLAILFMNAMAPLVDHIIVGFNIRRRTKLRRA